MKKIISIIFVFLLLIKTALCSHPIGQHFILTLPETWDKKKLRVWLEQTKPAGVMLLASHCFDREKTKELVDFLQNEARTLRLPPLFVTIDWEGGIVSRPNEEGGFFSIPSPRALAQAGRSACFLGGMLIGAQARSVGINVNFAPSLDLFDPANRILATRCFSDDPEIVAESGVAFAHGLMNQGVLPVIKHFPGLGLGSGDTHVTDVTIEADEAAFEHNTKPFVKALSLGIPIVMATHAAFAQFDRKPATLSARARSWLKEKNETALCITDDFSMKAVTAHTSLEEAVLQALKAGYHLIIFSGAPKDQVSLINSLQPQIGSLTRKQREFLTEQYHAVRIFKKKYFPHKGQAFMRVHEEALSQFLAQRCLQQQQVRKNTIPTSATVLSVNLPVIRTPEKWFVSHEKSYLGNKLAGYGISVTEHIFDPKNNTSVKQFSAALNSYQPADDNLLIVQTFFYADNIWNEIQTQWLEALKPLQKNVIVISLGHPFEQSILPDAQIINVGSFHKPLLDVVAEKIYGGVPRTGANEIIDNPEPFLRSKRFGILCHRCSVAQYENTDVFLPDGLYEWAIKQNDNTKLAAIFCPEHGLLGTQEAFAHIESENQSRWDCPVHSLHGTHKKPTPEMMQGLDVLVIDLQEVGVRCFTYLSTLQLALEAAAENNVEVIVLDRPNPLAAWGEDGPTLEKAYESFLGKLNVPFLHGSTIGTLAHQINQNIGAKLSVIACSNNQTLFKQQFIPPSPNLCSIDHIFAYPLTVFLESTNYSEGRGTMYPFLQFGAPWVDEKKLADTLNAKRLPGLYFEPVIFTPQQIPGIAENPKHKKVECHGVFVHIFDHDKVKPMSTAKIILDSLFTLYPYQTTLIKYGSRYALDSLVGNASWRNILEKKLVKR